uniref:Ig-like domain-containing protein n=1 Tax=Oncorhynchus kisutch TaxID=8019 RepID=A0A8C7JSI6_ONCKI
MSTLPPVFRYKIQPLEINVGSGAKFECEIEDAPNVNFKWFKSGTSIKESSNCCILSRQLTSSLELLSPTKADSGEYNCKATNQHGSDTCAAKLTVIEMYPPVFSTMPDPMTLYVGKQASFQCVVTGSSPMTIVWHKDNIAVSSWGNYQIASEKTKYSLQIKNLQLIDQGTYIYKALNSVGTATCSSELRVINKPSFVKTFETSVSSAIGNTLRLEGQEDEDTGVSITWIKDGKKLHRTMDCIQSSEENVVVLEITKAKLKEPQMIMGVQLVL